MSVIEVTNTQFRNKLKAFFDMADKGEKVIIRRGEKRAYKLVPLTEEEEDDLYFSPEMMKKIEKSLQEVKEGKTIEYTPELRKELFGDL